MWTNILDEIIIEKKSYGEEVNTGANSEEIIAFCKIVQNVFNTDVPQSFIDFLKVVNGLEFNGYIIYGIDQRFIHSNPNQKIYGFLEHNEIFHENVQFKDYFFFGSSGISWFVYNFKTKKYLELDNPTGEIVEEYNDLELLLEKIFREAIA